jgi:hypothetical protein
VSHDPRNGSFWIFYGSLAALAFMCALVIAYAAGVVRPRDLERIEQVHKEGIATKAAFDTLVVGRTPEGFHRHDMREWCEAFERANRGTGIVCPDPYSLPGFRNPR